MHLLKFKFRGGLFYKELPNSQKSSPPGGPPHNLEIGPQAQNQKSALPRLFGSSTAFQNGMTWPSSTNNQEAGPLQGKGLGAGQGLTGGDWAGGLLTQKLLEANQASPENFVQIHLPIQKLLMISVGQTHGQMDGDTNSIQN